MCCALHRGYLGLTERADAPIQRFGTEGKGVTGKMKGTKHFLRKIWYSPLLLVGLVIALEAGKKFPGYK